MALHLLALLLARVPFFIQLTPIPNSLSFLNSNPLPSLFIFYKKTVRTKIITFV